MDMEFGEFFDVKALRILLDNADHLTPPTLSKEELRTNCFCLCFHSIWALVLKRFIYMYNNWIQVLIQVQQVNARIFEEYFGPLE